MATLSTTDDKFPFSLLQRKPHYGYRGMGGLLKKNIKKICAEQHQTKVFNCVNFPFVFTLKLRGAGIFCFFFIVVILHIFVVLSLFVERKKKI